MNAGRLILVLLLAAGISIGSAVLGQYWVASRSSPKLSPEGGPAQLESLPSFRLPDLEGREVASADWAGKILVLNYWATWCPPCLNEMPLLASVQDARGDQGVQVVGIAIDRAGDVRGFLAKHPVSYPVVIGNPEAVALARKIGNLTQGLPFTAIFDREGRRVFSRTGELTSGDLQAQLDRLTGNTPDTTRQGGAEPSD